MIWQYSVCLTAIIATLWQVTPSCAQPSHDEARDALHQSVSFFREHASASGGYVYQLSADLSRREGEGRVGKSTAWMEPPATPSVGMAYLVAYQQCGDATLLDAAQETAGALVRGQLRSGGWDNRIEFDPDVRAKYAYRVDPDNGGKRFNTTTFDDDKSQSAIRFLMRLDAELEFKAPVIHECVTYALDAAMKSQYTNGAWPQRYSQFPDRNNTNLVKASLPDQWSRQYPGEKYSGFYTLNDNTISDLIVTMLDAWEVYDDARYLTSAVRGGDFLVLAQLPPPQPGWAQQYDAEMHPAWARKFEPPAVSGGESQGVIRTLMLLYRRTAGSIQNAERFLEPVPPAIAYFRRVQLENERLARFYELRTNRPLYFTKEYELVYESDDLPTHYGFVVTSKLDQLQRELQHIRQTSIADLWPLTESRKPKRSSKFDRQIEQIIDDLDSRGAWVEAGRLRYYGDGDPTKNVIRSETFARNLKTLAEWIAADSSQQ